MRKHFDLKNKLITYSFLFVTAAALPFIPAATVSADSVTVGPPIAQEIILGFSTADNLNLRASASTSSESLMKINAGDSMIILGEEDDWYKVEVDGKTGYMMKIFVNDECIAFATTQNLNLRKTPEATGAVINQFNEGDSMLVIEQNDEWLKVSYDDTIGYVSREFVDFQYNIYIKGNGINIRRGAHTEAEVITTLDNATVVTVIRKVGEWYKVRYDGQVGYVKDTCTSFTEPEEIVIEEPVSTTSSSSSNRTSSSSSSSNKTTSSSSSSSKNYSSSSSGSTASGSGQAVVNYALNFVGNPYRYGGNSLTSGIDCSGFVHQIYKHFGVSVPRSSSALRSAGRAVSGLSNAKPGDIICYSGHVAIYMGGNKIVHASNRKDGIKVSYNASYRNIVAIRRIFN